MPGCLTTANELGVIQCNHWHWKVWHFVLIFLPIFNDLCPVLPQPATSAWLQSQGFWLGPPSELCSSSVCKGRKKGKWLNVFLCSGEVFSEQKGLWSFQETFRLSSQDLLLGAFSATGSPVPL